MFSIFWQPFCLEDSLNASHLETYQTIGKISPQNNDQHKRHHSPSFSPKQLDFFTTKTCCVHYTILYYIQKHIQIHWIIGAINTDNNNPAKVHCTRRCCVPSPHCVEQLDQVPRFQWSQLLEEQFSTSGGLID